MAAAGAVDTTSSGFSARVTQIPIGRGPGDANSIANAEHARHVVGLREIIGQVVEFPFVLVWIPVGAGTKFGQRLGR